MQLVAVQLDMIWEDRAANHNKIRALLDDVKVEPGSLIVLPEMFDTGFSMNIESVAQSERRESEAFLRDLAHDCDAAVLGGTMGPITTGRSCNEAVAFEPSGREIVRYRKMQLFTPSGEDEKFVRGDSHGLFSWRDVQIAPFICYDLRFPEVFRPAARAGAELFVVIACWPAVRSEHWVRLLQARAIENQAFTLGVNRCGTDPHLIYDGRSTAFDPLGNALFEAGAAEQVLTFEINPDAARQWRDQFPALKDVRDV